MDRRYRRDSRDLRRMGAGAIRVPQDTSRIDRAKTSATRDVTGSNAGSQGNCGRLRDYRDRKQAKSEPLYFRRYWDASMRLLQTAEDNSGHTANVSELAKECEKEW